MPHGFVKSIPLTYERASTAAFPADLSRTDFYTRQRSGCAEWRVGIVRAGFTMQEVVDLLHDEYGWSDSVSNLSAKLQRESIRYKEVMELADVLGYDLVWKRRER